MSCASQVELAIEQISDCVPCTDRSAIAEQQSRLAAALILRLNEFSCCYNHEMDYNRPSFLGFRRHANARSS